MLLTKTSKILNISAERLSFTCILDCVNDVKQAKINNDNQYDNIPYAT